MQKIIPERLQEALREKGLTQAELADVIDKKSSRRNDISNYINGKRDPSPAMLKKIADALGTTPAYLTGLENSEKFHENLYLALVDNGMSQKDLAAAIEKNTTTVSLYLNGKNTPSLNTVEKICEILHVSPKELWNLKETDENSYAGYLRTLMKENNLNKTRLSKKSKVYVKKITAFLEDGEELSYKDAAKIAKVLHTAPEKLTAVPPNIKKERKRNETDIGYIQKDRVKECLKKKQMTQKDLTVAMGFDQVRQSDISHYVNGTRKPFPKVVKQMADALDTTPAYLMGLENSTKFNENLYLALVENKMSQVELADAIKKDRVTVSYYIKGRTTPSYDTVERIAKVLHTTPDALWNIDGLKEKETSPSGYLRILMKENGITERELSKRSNVCVSAISRFLQGKDGLSYESVKKLATALHTDTKFLLPMPKDGSGRGLSFRLRNAGITQKEVAKELGISQSQVCYRLKGKGFFTKNMEKKIEEMIKKYQCV